MSKSIYEAVIDLLDSKETFIEINLSTLWTLEYSDYMSLVGVIKKAQQQEKLLELYKELSYIRLMLFCETEPDEGQRLMDKDTEILKRIKELEINENSK